MTILLMDGFDGRYNLDNGWNNGEYYKGWGLYDYAYDGAVVSPPGGVAGILQGEGRFDGKNAASVVHDNYYDSSTIIALDKNTPSLPKHWRFGMAWRGMGWEDALVWSTYLSSTWRVLLRLEVQAEGNMKLSRRAAGGSTSMESFSFSSSAGFNRYGWNTLHGIAGIGLGTNNDYFKVYCNGYSAINLSSVTLSQAYGAPASISFSALSEIDDIYVETDPTTPFSDPGENGMQRVLALMPTAAGSDTTFTPVGAATNWEAVDEMNQDFDTTYNSSDGTSGHRDSFIMSNLSDQVNAGTISGVAVRCMASADAAEQIKPYVTIGGTRYYGSNFSPPSGRYLYCEYIFETNPATASAWLAAELDGLEVGYEVV